MQQFIGEEFNDSNEDLSSADNVKKTRFFNNFYCIYSYQIV